VFPLTIPCPLKAVFEAIRSPREGDSQCDCPNGSDAAFKTEAHFDSGLSFGKAQGGQRIAMNRSNA
jgi:hypothetical protein